ncbi:type VI secretion system tip protein TssI/VgrG [Sorangium sp. So ce1014]|uniref:type VI secretion system Vgr family protein n=1 Tax=Sorangium sp. So ce1014 TaxID=3133326 RepID=UPI003F626B4A
MPTAELAINGVDLDVDIVRGTSGLSRPFAFRAQASKASSPPELAELVGAPFTLTLRDAFNVALEVRGVVMSAERTAGASGDATFDLSLEPEVAPLSVGQGSRVFQEMTAVDIVKEVLSDAGVPGTAIRWSTSGSYPKRPYCVQYHESDWAFVERLLGEEGIFYHFEWSDGATTLVLLDDSTAAPDIEGGAALPFRDDSALASTEASVVRVGRKASLVPTGARIRDYSFDKPRLDLDAEAGSPTREIYDFPGRFGAPSDGDRLARVRLEGKKAHEREIFGESISLRLRPGQIFELTEHPIEALNGRYLVEFVSYSATVHGEMHLIWRAIPAATPYRAAASAVTRAPGGPQTGVVVGPSGEEVYPDKSGRIRVKHWWDRSPARDETASTWMRVGQFPLGGSMVLPRIGWDTLVHHHEGDIDAPFVLTHLYDGAHPVPYALPAGKTRTAWQTATTPGGGTTNEIRFEDKKGSEEIFINASKDMNVVVGDNKQTKVGVDHVHDIGSNLGTTIGGQLKVGVVSSQSVSIGGSETLNVSSDRTITVSGAESATVGGSRSVTASSGVTLSATGGRTLTVGGTMTSASALAVARMALGTMSVTVGGSWISAAATGLANVTGGASSETVGGAKIHLGAAGCETGVKGALAETVGGAYVIAAGGNVSESSSGALALTVGGAFVANAPAIEIEGESEISIRCGASVLTISSGSVEVKAPSLASPGATISKKASKVNHN